ncbi:MAG: hypothetical protein WAR57_14910, partial [Candidatus Phosphoribacter sp.]
MATPDLLAEATSLHAEAVAALGRYQPDVASALLDRVDAVLITHREAALADPRAPALDGVQQLRTRALLARGWAAYDRSGPDAAEAIIRAATDLARQIGRPDLIALCHMQQASVRGRAGDLAGALELMDRAELGADALPAADLARLLANRGVLAAQLMRLTQAEADLARAADVAHDARTPEIEFMARHNLGYVFYLRGDLPRALALMDSADAMPAEVNRAVSRLDRARVLLEAGLLDEARAGLDEARRLAEADGVQALIGEIELDLARTCLLVGDAAGARELA